MPGVKYESYRQSGYPAPKIVRHRLLNLKNRHFQEEKKKKTKEKITIEIRK